jgi:hypothetical protein
MWLEILVLCCEVYSQSVHRNSPVSTSRRIFPSINSKHTRAVSREFKFRANIGIRQYSKYFIQLVLWGFYETVCHAGVYQKDPSLN